MIIKSLSTILLLIISPSFAQTFEEPFPKHTINLNMKFGYEIKNLEVAPRFEKTEASCLIKNGSIPLVARLSYTEKGTTISLAIFYSQAKASHCFVQHWAGKTENGQALVYANSYLIGSVNITKKDRQEDVEALIKSVSKFLETIKQTNKLSSVKP